MFLFVKTFSKQIEIIIIIKQLFQEMIGSKVTIKQVNQKFRIVHNFSEKKRYRQSICQVPTDLLSCVPIHSSTKNQNKIQDNQKKLLHQKEQYKTLNFGRKKQKFDENEQQNDNYNSYLKAKKIHQQIGNFSNTQQLRVNQFDCQVKQKLYGSRVTQLKNLKAGQLPNQTNDPKLKQSHKLNTKHKNTLFLNIKTLTPLKKLHSSSKHKNELIQHVQSFSQANQQQSIRKTKDKKLFQIKTDTQQKNQYIESEFLSNSQNKVVIKRSNISRSSQSTHQKRKSISILDKNQKNKQVKYLNSSFNDFCFFIQLANNFICLQQNSYTFKAFVGKGNNSTLIKSILKSRSWISLCETQAQANFYWTQSRDQHYIQKLKTFEGQNNAFNYKINCFYQFKIETNPSDKSIRSNSLTLKKYENTSQEGFHKLCSKRQKQSNKNQLKFQFLPQLKIRQINELNKLKIHNHLEFNWNLTNKKALYYNLKSYYLAINQNPFQFIPLTYHVQQLNDKQWKFFQAQYIQRALQIQKNNQIGQKVKQKNLWIIKPGQNSNRGTGIQVSQNLDQIKEIVKTKGVRANGKKRSHIIQKYLIPYLYNKRKFDIRCYILVTSINGILKCYWYEQGYIRTASKPFTTKNIKNRTIHLTNDAIQKHSQQYGKYQAGNKLSFADFQKYLNSTTNNKLNFYDQIYPQMMKLAADAIRSTALILDEKNRQFSFQIFGLDFMIDEHFQTYLIQVNTNPCLELSSPLLARIIPSMLQNAFKISMDPFFTVFSQNSKLKNLSKDVFMSNKFVLIFDSRQQRQKLGRILTKANLDGVIESDQQNQIEEIDQ